MCILRMFEDTFSLDAAHLIPVSYYRVYCNLAGMYYCIVLLKNSFSQFIVPLCADCYSHLFSKNTYELDIVLTRTVNILTTNERVKLTML